VNTLLCLALVFSNIFCASDNGQNDNRFLKLEGYIIEKTVLNDNEAYLIQKTPEVNTYLVIDSNTISLGAGGFNTGDKIIAVYDGMKAHPMVYPGQYEAIIIAPADSGTNYKLDYFNSDLMSSDNTLKLNVNDMSSIFNLKNEKVADIKNKQLFVEYNIFTKNEQVQATPKSIYVMEYLNPGLAVFVKDKKIKNPVLYQGGHTMLPVREVCESLGISVHWDPEEYSVAIPDNYKIFIGDRFFYCGENSYELEAGPFISGDRAYVPVSFFDVLLLNTKVRYNNGNIFIYKI
jgi:hypothetical protein